MYSYNGVNITENTAHSMHEHLVDEYYIIIPRYWAIDGVGAINSKHPIKITEKNSILVWDAQEKDLVNKPITEIMQEPKRYHMIIGSPDPYRNYEMTIDAGGGEPATIELNYITGFMLALYLKQQAGLPNVINTALAEMLEGYEDEWSKWFDLEYEFYRKTYNSSLSQVVIKNLKDSSFKTLVERLS